MRLPKSQLREPRSLGYIEPRGQRVITPDPIALLRGAPNPGTGEEVRRVLDVSCRSEIVDAEKRALPVARKTASCSGWPPSHSVQADAQR
jgi:hypothetical protein